MYFVSVFPRRAWQSVQEERKRYYADWSDHHGLRVPDRPQADVRREGNQLPPVRPKGLPPFSQDQPDQRGWLQCGHTIVRWLQKDRQWSVLFSKLWGNRTLDFTVLLMQFPFNPTGWYLRRCSPKRRKHPEYAANVGGQPENSESKHNSDGQPECGQVPGGDRHLCDLQHRDLQGQLRQQVSSAVQNRPGHHHAADHLVRTQTDHDFADHNAFDHPEIVEQAVDQASLAFHYQKVHDNHQKAPQLVGDREGGEQNDHRGDYWGSYGGGNRDSYWDRNRDRYWGSRSQWR